MIEVENVSDTQSTFFGYVILLISLVADLSSSFTSTASDHHDHVVDTFFSFLSFLIFCYRACFNLTIFSLFIQNITYLSFSSTSLYLLPSSIHFLSLALVHLKPPSVLSRVWYCCESFAFGIYSRCIELKQLNVMHEETN